MQSGGHTWGAWHSVRGDYDALLGAEAQEPIATRKAAVPWELSGGTWLPGGDENAADPWAWQEFSEGRAGAWRVDAGRAEGFSNVGRSCGKLGLSALGPEFYTQGLNALPCDTGGIEANAENFAGLPSGLKPVLNRALEGPPTCTNNNQSESGRLQELAGTACAVAYLPDADTPLIAAISASARRKLSDFSTWELASTAGAFALRGILDAPLRDSIAAEAIAKITSAADGSGDLAGPAGAFARLSLVDGTLLASIAAASLRRRSEFSPLD